MAFETIRRLFNDVAEEKKQELKQVIAGVIDGKKSEWINRIMEKMLRGY
jgi:hypothetical protein